MQPAAAPTGGGSKGGAFAALEDDEEDKGGGAGGPSDALSVPAAAGPYRGKDFGSAANALRSAARAFRGPAAQKALSLASQVQKLGDAYGRAEAAKSSNPTTAVTEYQTAMGIDAQIGRGTHAAYFKQQAGKLAKDAAKQAYQQQKFDTAFEMAKLAQRFGDDGGVGSALKQKAQEMNVRALQMARSNPNGAKAMWRMVMRMVPPGDPAYQQATKGLSSAASASKDEDED